jgi:shikimate dehydrogenase
MFVGGVIAGHGVPLFLQAAESAGYKTANGGHMVEAAQDVLADFMLRKADSSTREGKTTPMLASP